MATFNEIEAAWANYLDAAIAQTVEFHQGFDETDRQAPCIVIAAPSGTEEPEFSGNYRIPIEIQVKDIAKAASGQGALDTAVHNALYAADLLAALNAQLATHNWQVVFCPAGSIAISRDRFQNVWETKYTFDLIAVAVDGTA